MHQIPAFGDGPLQRFSIHEGLADAIAAFSLPDILGFGSVFAPAMFRADYRDGSWQPGQFQPYGPISINPGAKVLHYAQEAFEGQKAYSVGDQPTALFRPSMNWRRLNASAARLCLPPLPEPLFLDGVFGVTALNEAFIPAASGQSLYLRPFLFGTESNLGMAAISAVIFALCNAGDHVVASHAIYGGTWALLNDFMPAKTGVRTSFVDTTNLVAVKDAITDRTRLLYVESMSNPTLRVADIPALAAIAHEAGIPLVVDNTFSPLVLSPARLGADIVVHSLTKFIGGASDLIGGAVCASAEFVGSLMDLHMGPLMILGPTLDPSVAASVALRLPHLALRMAAHGERALALAERAEMLGVTVAYPGLPGHRDRALIERIRHPDFGYGGLLTIDAGDEKKAMALMNTLQNDHQFGYVAVSLGYFDTLMSCSASSTSSEMPEEALRSAEISPGLVRMAIGYSGSLEQRWAQLETALRTTGLASMR